MSRLRAGIIGFAMVMMGAAGMVAIMPESVSAASCPGGKARLITFPAWYNGLVDGNCQFKGILYKAGDKIGGQPVAAVDIGKKINVMATSVRIALNIVEIILQLVAYATVVYLILGGFNYMTAAGDSGKITNAKKTIERALIGLLVALASIAIVNLVGGAV